MMEFSFKPREEGVENLISERIREVEMNFDID